MHIIALEAENVKKLRVVEIQPKGRVVQITGRNGQGKSTVLDCIWYALAGKRALPEKPVRRGAEKARIKLDMGELIVTRTISASGTMTLTIEDSKGKKFSSPQAALDELLGALTFDPLKFIGMDTKEQINALRAVVKLDLDVDAIKAANEKDFLVRRDINRDIDRLKGVIATHVVQADLPKARLDERPLLEQLQSAGARNEEARTVDAAWNELQQRMQLVAGQIDIGNKRMTELGERIKQLQQEMDRLGIQRDAEAKGLAASEARLQELNEEVKAAPRGEYVDVSGVTQQLQQLQLTNREIDKRTAREASEKELKEKQKQADALTRAMEDREEAKRTALASAAMPVPGLAFDEETVSFNGIPLEQLGEAEQIRISTSIAMAANPKLRILLIQHGEAMDDDALAVLAEMAEANDFQIWMARVDTSGNVGIVMEDGTVKHDAQDGGGA